MASYVDLVSIHNPATGTAPPATWGDQIRENETYLYERGPYICTAATRPGSPFAGQQIFETDTKKTLNYDGTDWWTIAIAGNGATAHTSSVALAQAGAVASTIVISEYRIICGVCEWWFVYTATAGGASGNAVTLLCPVAASAANLRNVGAGIINDSSGVTIDSGTWELLDTTHIVLETSRGTSSVWGATPNIGIANGDSLRGHVRYRVANAA